MACGSLLLTLEGLFSSSFILHKTLCGEESSKGERKGAIAPILNCLVEGGTTDQRVMERMPSNGM